MFIGIVVVFEDFSWVELGADNKKLKPRSIKGILQ